MGRIGRKLALALLIGLTLSLSLAACGKKGPPVKPDPTYPHKYPYNPGT